jgi:signal transduction histidine kinase
MHSDAIEAPAAARSISSIDATHPEMLSQMSIVPYLADYLGDEVDVRQVRLLPLGCSWGTAAILVHDRAVLPPSSVLTAITSTWGAAIAAAIQHDGARRLGEQLADANHALAEAQEQLLRNQSLARLGEMAAGAAHEMNNPLAVISGRAQMLLQTLTSNAEEWKAARTIVEQAHRVSDLITALRLYAEPPKANRRPTDITAVLDDAVKALKRQLPPALSTSISLQIRKDMPTVWIDPTHVRQIVIDLLLNAIQAAPKTGIHLNARVDPTRQALVIQVSDDGHGMDEYTLSHAFDPFFSNRHAGRGVGMGLPRAQQLAATHHGKVDLRSTPGAGTLATVTLPLDSPS